jgi:hypothetical protein
MHLGSAKTVLLVAPRTVWLQTLSGCPTGGHSLHTDPSSALALQTLDTTALVITLANIALQLLAMVWMLLQTVKLAPVQALARVPGQAARSVTQLFRSASLKRSDRAKVQEAEKAAKADGEPLAGDDDNVQLLAGDECTVTGSGQLTRRSTRWPTA